MQFVKGETLDSLDKSNPTTNAQLVAKHYEARENQDVNRRNQSRILHLRNFNNWTKSVLINKYLEKLKRDLGKRRPVVLDMCCGKLGDFKKWKEAGVGYLVGADIAKQSLIDGLERYNTSNFYNNFPLTLIHADCANADITPHYNGVIFDICSCQFSLHYSFESAERARTIFKNITSNLRNGGYFFGTIPRACYLV